MRLLSVDPGGTTGFAWWRPDLATPFGYAMVPHGEDWAWLDSAIGGFDAVAYETYTIGAGTLAKSQDGKKSIETIGVVRFLARKQGIPAEGQSPSEARGFSSNEKLKRAGLVTPSRPDHARAAARHLLIAMVRHREIDPATLVAEA